MTPKGIESAVGSQNARGCRRFGPKNTVFKKFSHCTESENFLGPFWAPFFDFLPPRSIGKCFFLGVAKRAFFSDRLSNYEKSPFRPVFGLKSTLFRGDFSKYCKNTLKENPDFCRTYLA